MTPIISCPQLDIRLRPKDSESNGSTSFLSFLLISLRKLFSSQSASAIARFSSGDDERAHE